MGGACNTDRKGRKCIQNFGRKSRRKELIWKTRRRWEGNIKIDLKKIRWNGVNWIHLT